MLPFLGSVIATYGTGVCHRQLNDMVAPMNSGRYESVEKPGKWPHFCNVARQGGGLIVFLMITPATDYTTTGGTYLCNM